MGEIIAFASLKGGTGKSVICATISSLLSDMGKKVLLVDGCISIGTLDLITGLDNIYSYNYIDAINGECKKEEITYTHEKHKNLDIMFAPRLYKSFNETDFKNFFLETAFEYDYIIMDTPIVSDETFNKIAGFADKAVIITTPDIVSAKLSEKTMIFVENSGINEKYIIINKFSIDLKDKYDMIDIDEILNVTGGTLLGIVPFDLNCLILSGKDNFANINNEYLFVKACENIARRLNGEKVPVLKVRKSNIFKIFNR